MEMDHDIDSLLILRVIAAVILTDLLLSSETEPSAGADPNIFTDHTTNYSGPFRNGNEQPFGTSYAILAMRRLLLMI